MFGDSIPFRFLAFQTPIGEVTLRFSFEDSPGLIPVIVTLNPGVRLESEEAGECLIRDEDGIPFRRIEDAAEKGLASISPSFDIPTAKLVLQNSVANQVRSSLIFQMLIRDKHPPEWEVNYDDRGVHLSLKDGDTIARIEDEQWWFVSHPIRARSMAKDLAGQTGLPLIFEKMYGEGL